MMRLRVMAAERAPAKATTVQKSVLNDGRFGTDKIIPDRANGSANTVCSILIISHHSRTVAATHVRLAKLVLGFGEGVWTVLTAGPFLRSVVNNTFNMHRTGQGRR